MTARMPLSRALAIALVAAGLAAGSPAGARAEPEAAFAEALAAHRPSLDPVAEDLHLLLSGSAGALTFDDKRHIAALKAFYADRNWQPAWTKDGALTERGLDLLDRLAHADEDGLDPAAYKVPEADPGAVAGTTPQKAARLEVAVALAALTYAEDAEAGRIDPQEISGYIKQRPVRPDPIEVLKRLAEADDPGRTLQGYNPPHEGYRRLRAKLAELRRKRDEATAERPDPLPAGGNARLGDTDPRVPLLRKHLDLAEATGDANTFDEDVDAALRRFQEEHRLTSDGILGPRTVAALNGTTASDPIADIVTDMEIWRWLPRDLGRNHVYVNIPEFLVRVVDNGRVVHRARVVVGKVHNQTPVFSDEMEHIVVNPYWNVPYSIATKEMLPSIRANPGAYFARRGYEVVYRGRVVSPYSVEWSAASLRNIRIRQRPSARNALGRLKFMFPNKYSIYLHDTPSKTLFKRNRRAFSHGCVRVQDPLELADVLLAGTGWNAARLESIFGRGERRIELDHHIPVHLTYFTTIVNGRGELKRLPDIYGHHERLKKALKL
ncbi:murein L,D-transpeptidase YcbB/YkuD [Rhodobium orientis]|nr:L,D-transpeptidase family protein [Rhodobium orientis]MBB4302949.1 murein L,D-transpeptidase YcbB/YkuD [Rhodobium orientis]